MISRIRGVVLRRDVGIVELMTPGGVAYEVEIPLSVFERIPPEGADLELRTWQVFREDGVELYGFLEAAERAVFARMLTASGVGPKLALSMLSTMPPARLVRAIAQRDIAALRTVPGLGARKAEKLVVELADRVEDLAVAVVLPRGDRPGGDEAVSALVALGFNSVAAAAAVREALDADASLAGSDLIKAALAAAASSK
jgi:holliday junction DNA helicase RuvA